MNDVFNQHGAFSWNELMTTDVTAAKTFYAQVFGWTFDDMDMGQGVYSVVSVEGVKLAGIMAIPDAAAGAPPHWNAYVTVENVDAVAEQVPQLGGKVLVEPTDIPSVGRFSMIQDPQGATISIITYAEE